MISGDLDITMITNGGLFLKINRIERIRSLDKHRACKTNCLARFIYSDKKGNIDVASLIFDNAVCKGRSAIDSD